MYDVLDLTEVEFSKGAIVTGTDGCYMKAKVPINGSINYIKLSLFNDMYGFVGYESINEVIVSRLGHILGLPVLEQKLKKVKVYIDGRVYITFACCSRDYLRSYSRVSFGDYYRRYKIPNELPVDTLNRTGYGFCSDVILMFDYLIIGRDRHENNIEFLTSGKYLVPAPIFDNGISLLAPITGDLPIDTFKRQVLNFRELDDYIGNNFLGSRSISSNLRLIKKPIAVNKLRKSDRSRIFYNLSEVLPDFYKDKVWSIISYRYSYLRKVGIIVEK